MTDDAIYADMFQKFIAWEKTTHDTIDFKRIYVDMAGDILAGLALSEIMFWHLPTKTGVSRMRISKKGHEWVACTRNEWWDRTRMSPRQVDNALKKLVGAGIIYKATFVFAGAPTTHVRVNYKGFFVLWNSLVNSPMENPYITKPLNEGANHQTVKSISPNGEIHITKSAISITETTTQITTENKDQVLTAPQAAADSAPELHEVVKPSSSKKKRITPHEPEYNALLQCFDLKKVTGSGGAAYWKVAAELHAIDFPVDRIRALYLYVKGKAQRENWSTWTVNSIAKYAGDFLRDNPLRIVITEDEPDHDELVQAAGGEGQAYVPREQVQDLLATVTTKLNGNRNV